MARKRRLVAEINVVPYIDVMLVLLIIFMITAPLSLQEINVNLPDADAQPTDLTDDTNILLLSVLADGRYMMNVGAEDQIFSPSEIESRVTKILAANPGIRVYVEGDEAVSYGKVIEAMGALEDAGAQSVGLLTEPRK